MNVHQLGLLLFTLRRRLWLICACACLGLVLAIIHCVVAVRIFESNASLLVEYNHEQLHKTSGDSVNQAQFDDMATQSKLLQSRLLLDRALASLQPFQMDPAFANLMPEERRKAVEPNLTVTIPRGSRMISLIYRSPNPTTATALLQALTDTYLKFVNETHRNSSREALEVLTKQKDELEEQLLESEQKVMEMRQEVGVGLGEKDRKSIIEKRMAALQDELTKAQVTCIRAESIYRMIANAPPGAINPDLLHLRNGLGQALLSDSFKPSEAVRQWKSSAEAKLADDEVEFRRLEGVYGPNHPVLKTLKDRIESQRILIKQADMPSTASTEKRSEKFAELVKKMVHQEFLEAQVIEKKLQNKIEEETVLASKQNAKYVKLQTLESKLDRMKAFYDIVLKRIKELDIGEHLSQVNVTVVGPPTVPKKPVSPKIVLVLIMGLCAGMAFGACLALLLDRLDNKFVNPEEIQHLLDAPIIGNVPKMRADLTCPPVMLMAQASESLDSEAFRSIRTWLFFAKDARTLSISSPLQGDGKSTIITNVGSALAQAGKRTLIIDCDLRRPRQQSAWGLPSTRGISYLLQKGIVNADAIAAEVHVSLVPNLDILPAGSIPAHPAELLEKSEMLDLLQWAKDHYNYVLIDAPPLIPVADTSTIARLVDGMILVVNLKTNGRGHALEAKNKILSVGGKLLGVVANGISQQTSYGYSYGGYGYRQDPAQGGETQEQTDETLRIQQDEDHAEAA